MYYLSGMHTFCDGGGMGIWMLLVWVLPIVFLVGAVFFFVRKGNFNQEKTPLDILKDRYARGEVSKQEYEEKKKAIM